MKKYFVFYRVIWVYAQHNKIKGVLINSTPFLHLLTRLIPFIFLLLTLKVSAQNDTVVGMRDSISVTDTSQFNSAFRKKFSSRWHMIPHSPLKATVFSMLLPGTGQIYNGHAKQASFAGKYWKVPIVYAGIATCVAFIDYNNRKYNYYKEQYIAYVDGDDDTVPTLIADPNQINKVQDQFHRWRDVSYMSLLGVYIFQMIDANVDAHLFYFDVGKELSLKIHPSFVNTGQIKPGIGVTFGF